MHFCIFLWNVSYHIFKSSNTYVLISSTHSDLFLWGHFSAWVRAKSLDLANIELHPLASSRNWLMLCHMSFDTGSSGIRFVYTKKAVSMALISDLDIRVLMLDVLPLKGTCMGQCSLYTFFSMTWACWNFLQLCQ